MKLSRISHYYRFLGTSGRLSTMEELLVFLVLNLPSTCPLTQCLPIPIMAKM